MNEDKFTYAAYFTLGALSAFVFSFFMHDRVFSGIVAALVVGAAAAHYSKEDIKEELVLLRTVPLKFSMVMKDLHAEALKMREAFEVRVHGIERELRQKRLLRRNRIYRTRRFLSV